SLCTGIPKDRQFHYDVVGAGHYGIFSGRRWREKVYPQVRDFIAGYQKPGAKAPRAAGEPASASSKAAGSPTATVAGTAAPDPGRAQGRHAPGPPREPSRAELPPPPAAVGCAACGAPRDAGHNRRVPFSASLAEALDRALPQTQCTRCGYADCRAYAEALTD